MTNIAYVREFNGSSDYISVSPGAIDNVAMTGFSVAAIFKHDNVANYRNILSAGSYHFNLNGVDSCPFELWNGASAAYSRHVVTATDGWHLAAITKPSGSSIIRSHLYKYTAQTWAHDNDDNPAAWTWADDTPTGADIGRLFGSSSEFWDGQIAVIGVWQNDELNDSEIETLAGSIAAWESLSPTALWLLDQASTSTPVPDRTGNGADESSKSGTTVVVPSGLTFDVGGAQSSTGERGFRSRGGSW